MFKNKKNNKNDSELKELMSTPRGKAIVFFGAYLIFFIIAAILAFIGYSYVNKDKKEIDNFNFNQININEVL